MEVLLLFFLLALITATTQANPNPNPNQFHLLRMKTGSAGIKVPQMNCLSWRLAVETNNLQNWKLVPMQCENYVGNYMLGKQYRLDCEAVADAAIEYANSLSIPKDGRSIWVFDIDETTLSNLPYYARADVAFGAIPYNEEMFNEWVGEGKAPAIPAMLALYQKLLSLGIKAVFLSGTNDKYTDVRIKNLKEAGYTSWEKLILKGPSDPSSAVLYKGSKRTELVKAGYRIVGNIGDQWSDLIGEDVGDRTFKVPDPMYYIG
ncbi:hypothetical protein Leryth_005148 [Lithospermum erythrorhizon]|nr:hypothetical protein Leryth_005148 [Lithospermum erythrorhizon]